jgi:hypothetical protein
MDDNQQRDGGGQLQYWEMLGLGVRIAAHVPTEYDFRSP